MNLTPLLNGLVNGIYLGSSYIIMTSGLVLILGVLKVLNFAHGAMYMLGGYFGYTWLTMIMHGDLAFPFGIFVVFLSIGGIGVVIERYCIKKVYSANVLYQFLITYGFILILDGLVTLIWGTRFKNFGVPEIFRVPPISIGGTYIPIYYLFTIGLGLLVGIGLWLMIEKTRFGKLIVAAASDSETLSALGVNVPLLYTVVFGFGCALGGLGGFIAGPILSIYPGMGSSVIIDWFVVIVVGGVSIRGAIGGSLLVGLVRSYGNLISPQYELAFIYVLMVAVLLIRPTGLLGGETVH
jgi:branched-subunit amino acid ABC-type transport system permease component